MREIEFCGNLGLVNLWTRFLGGRPQIVAREGEGEDNIII